MSGNRYYFRFCLVKSSEIYRSCPESQIFRPPHEAQGSGECFRYDESADAGRAYRRLRKRTSVFRRLYTRTGCRLLPFIGRSRPHAAASDLSRQQSDSVAPKYDERVFLREVGSGFYPAGYTPRAGRFAPGCGFRTLERSFAPLSGRAAGTADARFRIPEIYDALCPYGARRCTALSGCNLFAGNLSLQRYAQGPAGHVLLYAIHDGSFLRNAD